MVYIVYMDTTPIGFYDPNDYYVIWLIVQLTINDDPDFQRKNKIKIDCSRRVSLVKIWTIMPLNSKNRWKYALYVYNSIIDD